MSLKLGNLRVESPSFQHLGRMPKRHAGDADNLSPPLEWSGAPAGTREFAVLCFDPDAPRLDGVTHWVLYGIPSNVTSLPEGEGADAYTGGVNITGKPGYLGPRPPPGHGAHHYYFWVFALDGELGLKPGLDRPQLMDAIKGHVLEQARLVGIYER